MAITLSSLSSSLLQSGSLTGQSSVQQNAAVSDAFKAADARTSNKLATTEVQLSSYGQAKSAIADLQSSAKTLSATTQNTKASQDDIKRATETFVSNYNSALNKTLNTASSSASSSASTTTRIEGSDTRARLAGNDLRNAVTQNGSASNLSKIGITQKFAAALKTSPDQVKTALNSVADKLDQTTSKELSNTGNIGSTLSNLYQRQSQLQAQQSKEQSLQQAALQKVQTQTNQINSQSNAISAYQALFIR